MPTRWRCSAELDEIVDAANSLAAAAGLEGADEDDRPEG